MGIAPSEGVIVWTEALRGDSQAHFIEDFHAATIQGGWGSEAIFGGFMYTLASKQNLGCKMKLTALPDLGSTVMALQFLSLDETKVGYQHLVRVLPGRLFQLHLNRCQMFLSVAGMSEAGSFDFTAVQGGIPFVPRDALGTCGVDVGPTLTTEAWWSNGDTLSSNRNNFRNSHLGGGAWSACHNRDLMNTATSGAVGGYTPLGFLRLIPVTLAVSTDFYFGTVPRTVRASGATMYFDPLIQWGSGAVHDSLAYFRGQIYDAIQPSIDKPLDFKESRCGADWVNYMHDEFIGGHQRTRHGCLYLMRGVTPAPAKRGPYVY